jgi:5,10-methylenetetrahydromethanopterin reductase
MKFSLSLLPDVSPQRAASIAKLAEANDISGIWVVDEIFHRDVWITLASCAMETKSIRLGPGVTNVILRDPTLVAQALGTLEQLAARRTFCGISIGDPNRLALYNNLPPMNQLKPFGRLKESIGVIRELIHEGKTEFKGQFLKYSTMTTNAITKNKVPLYIGGMGGPKSFQLAGELGDGVTSAFGCSRKYHEYVLENVRVGERNSNRKVKKLPYAAWNIFCCAPKSEDAKNAARNYVALYIPSVAPKQIELQGVSLDAVQPIRDAFARGDIKAATALTTDEFVERFSVSGSPDEIIEKLDKEFVKGRVDELVSAIVDPEITGAMLGVKIKNVPGYPQNLRLVKRKIMPHIKSG